MKLSYRVRGPKHQCFKCGDLVQMGLFFFFLRAKVEIILGEKKFLIEILLRNEQSQGI